MSCSLQVVVHITDENDCTPEFLHSIYTRDNIPESVAAGTSLLQGNTTEPEEIAAGDPFLSSILLMLSFNKSMFVVFVLLVFMLLYSLPSIVLKPFSILLKFKIFVQPQLLSFFFIISKSQVQKLFFQTVFNLLPSSLSHHPCFPLFSTIFSYSFLFNSFLPFFISHFHFMPSFFWF